MKITQKITINKVMIFVMNFVVFFFPNNNMVSDINIKAKIAAAAKKDIFIGPALTKLSDLKFLVNKKIIPNKMGKVLNRIRK